MIKPYIAESLILWYQSASKDKSCISGLKSLLKSYIGTDFVFQFFSQSLGETDSKMSSQKLINLQNFNSWTIKLSKTLILPNCQVRNGYFCISLQLNLHETDLLFRYLSHHLTWHCLLISGVFPVLVCCDHKIVLYWYENQNKNNSVIILRKSWEIVRNQPTISCQIMVKISKL